MKVLLNNDLRVFQVVTSTGKQAFCNLEDLNKVIAELGTHSGYFKVYDFWNNKAQRVSNKLLKEMHEAHGLKMEFLQ